MANGRPAWKYANVQLDTVEHRVKYVTYIDRANEINNRIVVRIRYVVLDITRITTTSVRGVRAMPTKKAVRWAQTRGLRAIV